MPLYEFRCPNCGIVAEFAEQKARAATCSACGATAARRFSVPITDNRTVGRDMAAARTLPPWRRPHDHLQEERIRDYQRRDGTHRQFGPGKTTGT